MRWWLTNIFVGILINHTCLALHCYYGRSGDNDHNHYRRQCISDRYCIRQQKLQSTTTSIIRACDGGYGELSICAIFHIDNQCKFISDNSYGEVCCCDRTLCNRAAITSNRTLLPILFFIIICLV
jgi:hypothetical protein